MQPYTVQNKVKGLSPATDILFEFLASQPCFVLSVLWVIKILAVETGTFIDWPTNLDSLHSTNWDHY
jgi:hypothetical protein